MIWNFFDTGYSGNKVSVNTTPLVSLFLEGNEGCGVSLNFFWDNNGIAFCGYHHRIVTMVGCYL